MKTHRSALVIALIALSSGAACAADPGSETSRQDRMDQALQDYHGSPQSQAASSEGPAARTEDSIKRGYHKTADAVKRGAHKTEHAVKKGAHKVEDAAHSNHGQSGDSTSGN